MRQTAERMAGNADQITDVGRKENMAKIIVVDDDKASTALFEQVLLMKGYEVLTINESAKTIELANAVIPDLFILDLMMPQPDGFKLCRMLRADSVFRRTPIIIVTALNDVDSRLVAIGAGASDYLVKPFHIDELFSSIEKQLNNKSKLSLLPKTSSIE
jgi:DNA-binding response OmpR family regulator